MTGFKKVFIDTAPLIYYLERSEQYFDKMKGFFQDCCEHNVDIVTSAVTYEEYLVYPYRENRPELIDNFENFISSMDIRIISIDKEISCQRLHYFGVDFRDQTPDIRIVGVFGILNRLPDYLALGGKLIPSKLIRPIHKGDQVFLRVFVEIK